MVEFRQKIEIRCSPDPFFRLFRGFFFLRKAWKKRALCRRVRCDWNPYSPLRLRAFA